MMNKDIERLVGQNIRKQREAHEWTQDQLASKLQTENCDITRSALAKIEVGQRHLYVDELIILKAIFNVEYDELLSIK